MAESLERRVEGLVRAMSARVDLLFPGPRRNRIDFADRGAANLFDGVVSAGSYQRQQGRAVRRSFLSLQDHNRLAEYVGQHLPPGGRCWPTYSASRLWSWRLRKDRRTARPCWRW